MSTGSETLIKSLKFGEDGLIPAVVQDHSTGEVLMLAYMNAESLGLTFRTGETWFWSRSRNELWHKGETSGNSQAVVDVRPDCDGDTVLVRVTPRGPACHTGERTCFYGADINTMPAAAAESSPSRKTELSVVDLPALDFGILFQNLYQLIEQRRAERPPNSYTTYLFDSGLDKILKKVGEESAETIIAAKNEGRGELTAEITDLLYHLLVLMVEREVSLRDVAQELGNRMGRKSVPE